MRCGFVFSNFSLSWCIAYERSLNPYQFIIMTRKTIFGMLFVAFFLTVGFRSALTQGKDPSKHQAKKWFKKKEWLNGLQLEPSKTVDYVEFYRQYHANKAYWDKAFDFLKTQNLNTLTVG